MSVLRPLVLTAALAASSLVAAPAHAALAYPAGTGCVAEAFLDPTTDEMVETGSFMGGPVVLAHLGPTITGAGTLTCRVQPDNPTRGGGGPSVSGHDSTVVVAGPAQFTYQTFPGEVAYLCSEFVDDATGTTYYWTETTREWTTAAVPCDRFDSVPPLDDLTRTVVDPLVCPLLATLLPPDGDVPGIWDCPPYAS
jgi:hypothetical protein